ncbi:MAG: heme ABC exporter ATP-binding protein CcmA [Chloroflexota bacterium]
MPQTIYVSPRAVGAPDNPPPAIETFDLARLYDRRPAIAGVSLRVERGAVVALLGSNGAGKTTLLRILATTIRPSFGRAEIDGLDVGRWPELVRGRIGYLSHATGLYDDLTAAENLRFAATLLGLEPPDARERVPQVLATVALGAEADRRVRDFSAGMRRRVALARLLLGSPSVLLLDEPFESLDEAGMQLMGELLHAWQRAGVTCLVATHAAERLLPQANGSVHLEAGIVTAIGGRGVGLSDTPAAGPPRSVPAASSAGEASR